MGHIYGIENQEQALATSLEYYPHAKSVLSLLNTSGLGSPTAVMASSLVPQFNPYSSSRTETHITFGRGIDIRRDFSTLDGLSDLVKALSKRSRSWFEYSGIRPLVSAPLYAVLVHEDGSEELEAKVAMFVEVDTSGCTATGLGTSDSLLGSSEESGSQY